MAFPVRYPLGPLPFGMLLRGCIIALTNFRIVAFTYNRVTSGPATQLWSDSRDGNCSAELSSSGNRLTLSRSDGEVRNLVVPKNRAEVHRFVAAVSG